METFQVTKEHIAVGQKNNTCFCPVALAIREKITNCYVTVNNFTAILGEDYYTLPKPVSDFIEKFDNNLEVSPLEFELLIK